LCGYRHDVERKVSDADSEIPPFNFHTQNPTEKSNSEQIFETLTKKFVLNSFRMQSSRAKSYLVKKTIKSMII
jgi:hypothetical protein